MKYLVLSKGPSLARDAKHEDLSKAKALIQKGMDAGKIDACYGLVAGGTVWIINAESHGELARGLRAYHLSSLHDVEVYPLVEGLGALDAYIEQKKSA